MEKNIFRQLELYKCDTEKHLVLPLAEEGIHAGFPSPAQDYMELSIDLNEELIKNPASTFFGRVIGDCMEGEQVCEGDIVIVDKSLLPPVSGDMCVCYLEGEFTLRIVERRENDNNAIWLVPANDKYEPFRVTAENDFIVWGVVTGIIKQRGRKQKSKR